MGLMYWWMVILWILLAVAVYWLYRKKRIPAIAKKSVKVAHSARITGLPEYKKAQKVYRRYVMVLLILFCIALGSSMILSSRPVSQNLVSPAQRNRDIMLCLDVSGSMTEVDAKILDVYERLARDFKGQRIGLDIYNVNVFQVFPLTDDYDLVLEQLAHAKKVMSYDRDTANDTELGEYYDFLSGTGSGGMGTNSMSSSDFPSSNTGLGLAGCVQHLGENTLNRSQSVILATDNEISGDIEKSIITTPQAMNLAKKKGIRVYSIDPGMAEGSYMTDTFRGEHAELKTYSLLTSGGYYKLSSGEIVPDVIQKISDQEAKLFVGDSQLASTDTPIWGFIVLATSVLGITAISWRLKL